MALSGTNPQPEVTQMGRGMYALPSRPSKFVANARIGAPKTLNNLEIARDVEKQNTPQATVVMSSPKPIFNGNRARGPQYAHRQNSSPQQTPYSSQHEEMVRYLSEAWNRVNHELTGKREGGPVEYKEKNPNPRLREFKAFDLDQYWGERFMQQTTGSRS